MNINEKQYLRHNAEQNGTIKKIEISESVHSFISKSFIKKYLIAFVISILLSALSCIILNIFLKHAQSVWINLYIIFIIISPIYIVYEAIKTLKTIKQKMYYCYIGKIDFTTKNGKSAIVEGIGVNQSINFLKKTHKIFEKNDQVLILFFDEDGIILQDMYLLDYDLM